MRILAGPVVSLALLLGCAGASDSEPTDPKPAEEPAAQPPEAEGPAPTTESAVGLCALEPEWSACDGQRVRVRGRVAEHVMQHPILAPPEDYQGYMDADGRQLIVVTKAPFDCRGAMSVVGTLRGVSLGDPGDTRGKSSYSGWMIADAEVSCE